jgi:hypothetical protein
MTPVMGHPEPVEGSNAASSRKGTGVSSLNLTVMVITPTTAVSIYEIASSKYCSRKEFAVKTGE